MNKSLPLVFTFGLYRSGTTLVSRLLNGDQRFASASDPMRPFFNAYCNHLRNLVGRKASLFDPINEGFHDTLEYYQKLDDASFGEHLNAEFVDLISDQLVLQSKSYSPVFSDYINSSLRAKTFSEWSDMLQYLIDSLCLCYGHEDHSALAVKEVWTLEIAAPLLRYFKNRVKIVAILRDPADIFASSKYKAGNYPLMYISRHWRKNIALAHYLKSQYPAQVEILQYEKLCLEPLRSYNALVNSILPNGCNWEVDHLPTPMEDKGIVFSKNSSYEQCVKPFSVDSQSIGKYKSVLSSPERRWLQYLCSVSYLGNLKFDSTDQNQYLDSICEPTEPYPVRDKSTVAGWFNNCYPYYDTRPFLNRNLQLERQRFLRYLNTSEKDQGILPSLMDIVNQA